jgi:TetR/AcrR family transcriptional regulator, regulator of cefoperazone and chloramphenicol sensitivity
MLLNVRSVDEPGISAQERILRAALAVFAEHGYAGGSVRAIAQLARVSPALVLHHFASKEGLRAACDERVMSYTDSKGQMILNGTFPTVEAFRERHPEIDDALAYVVRVVTDGGPTSEQWYARWQSSSAAILHGLQQAGRVRADLDVDEAAALLTSFGFGVLGTQRLLARRLGGEDIMSDPAATAYRLLSTAIFTDGLFTSELSAADDPPPADRTSDTTTTTTTTTSTGSERRT